MPIVCYSSSPNDVASQVFVIGRSLDRQDRDERASNDHPIICGPSGNVVSSYSLVEAQLRQSMSSGCAPRGGRNAKERAVIAAGARSESEMAMSIGHPQTVDGVALEIELDQHRRLIAHDPAVMARIDGDNLGSRVFDHTAIGVLDVDPSPGEKAHVGMHAQVGPHNRLHIDRPAESGRVDHALDARGAGTPDLEPDSGDFAALGSFQGSEE
jgi:hypothetical protein